MLSQLLRVQDVTPVSEDRTLVARDTDRDALLDEVMVDIADWLTSYPLIVLHGSQNLSTVCTNSACTPMSLSSNVSPASSSNVHLPSLGAAWLHNRTHLDDLAQVSPRWQDHSSMFLS